LKRVVEKILFSSFWKSYPTKSSSSVIDGGTITGSGHGVCSTCFFRETQGSYRRRGHNAIGLQTAADSISELKTGGQKENAVL